MEILHWSIVLVIPVAIVFHNFLRLVRKNERSAIRIAAGVCTVAVSLATLITAAYFIVGDRASFILERILPSTKAWIIVAGAIPTMIATAIVSGSLFVVSLIRKMGEWRTVLALTVIGSFLQALLLTHILSHLRF